MEKGKYKISGTWSSDNGTKAGWSIRFAKNAEDSQLIYNYAANGFGQSFTVLESTYYRIAFYDHYDAMAGTTTTFSNIQLEKGSTATSYEPYEEKIYSVYVDEPLRCLDSTCDYIDLVNKKVIRKIQDDNGTLSILDNSIEEKIQSVDSDVLINRNIIVDGANVEQELDR